MNDKFYKKLNRAIKYIDSWLDLRYQRNEWPGFTVAISHKGKILFNKSYGYTNLDTKEKLTPNHIFRIASHSKTFTATAIMQLFEKKKLKLDDHMVKYLQWLSNHRDKRFKQITIKQLLSHKAGIIRDGLDTNYWLLEKPFPTKEEFIEKVLEADLVLDVNKKLKYSNIGYTLLGLIIEQVSGQSYEDFVIENIIKPLDLKNTGPEFTASIENKLVMGYSMKEENKKRKPFKTSIDTKVLSPATGFYSTSEDLCKFFYAQTVGYGKLLSDDSKKIMQKGEIKVPQSDLGEKYGLGMIVTPIGKRKKSFGHGGSFPGHNTSTRCDPENQLIVTVLTNCIDGLATHFMKGIFQILYYFEDHYSESAKLDLDKFEGRLKNIWGITDVVSIGKHLVAIYPDLFNPFEEVEILKYLKGNTLKIGKTNGYYSEGELVHYSFDKNQKIKSVKYAGATMLPENGKD